MNLADFINRKINRSSKKRDGNHIFIRLHNGNGCEVNFQPQDTIANLLKHCPNLLFQLPKSFKLLFQGKQICNFHLTAKEIGLQNKSILHVETFEGENFKLLTIDIGVYYKNDRIYIRMRIEETLKILKNKLEKVTQLKTQNQRIFFRGEELEDDKTISFYRMSNDSLLCLIDRQQMPNRNPFSKKPHPLHRLASDKSGQKSDEVESTQLFQYRSFRMNCPQKDLGYEISIKTKDMENEEQNDLCLTQHDFKFNFLSPKGKIPECQEDNIRSTQSEDESNHKQISSIRTDNLDGFSDYRQMII